MAGHSSSVLELGEADVIPARGRGSCRRRLMPVGRADEAATA